MSAPSTPQRPRREPFLVQEAIYDYNKLQSQLKLDLTEAQRAVILKAISDLVRLYPQLER